MQTELTLKSARTALVQGFLTVQLANIRRSVVVPDFLTLGRETGEGLILHDNFVSKMHCRVEKRMDEFWIRDLRSRNGTFVNGVKISEARLRPGDIILIGETEILFHSEDKNAESGFLLKSKNQKWQRVLDSLPRVARSDLPVLISGPTGSGKEIMARTIHQLSNRANKPFVSVNCSALAEGLVESELFGHRRGAFTGANEERKGAFQAAKGGTLFLDEIGDLPASVQPKLLRALENHEIKPVGSDDVVSTDVRVISATHKNLGRLAQKEVFREDLYYRLNVLRVHVPSLQERREDFVDFLNYFARSARVGFSDDAVQKLKTYSWPGQVRELKNFVAKASALFPGQRIESRHINSLFEVNTVTEDNPKHKHEDARTKVERFEIALICEKLIENKGNIRQSARDLGLPKSTLYDRIKAYRIDVREVLARSYFVNAADNQ